MPRRTFVSGEILTAANVNAFLMDQACMTFADDAARTSALPSPTEGMVTFLASTKSIDKRVGSAWVPASNGFTAGTAIVATNAAWPVPSLASPIVKVTVIGGGGGGAGGIGSGGGPAGDAGAAGGTTTFNAGGAGTVSAAGGSGGIRAVNGGTGATGTAGNVSANGGQGGAAQDDSSSRTAGINGNGGVATVQYLNLFGISTVNVTIGAGGAGGSLGRVGAGDGGAGGRGEVIVEYVAA